MDDPFFLDDTGANRFVASSLANPGHPDTSLLGARGERDTYAGFNSMLTVVSIPATMLRGSSNVIGVSAVTRRQVIQFVTRAGEVLSRTNITAPRPTATRAANSRPTLSKI